MHLLRSARSAALLSIAAIACLGNSRSAAAQSPSLALPTVIRAARVLDGTGRVLTRQDVRIADGRILSIQPSSGPLPRGGVDLGTKTLLPGLIDTHVHLGWYLTKAKRLHENGDGDTPAMGALQHAGNAWATLRAGFTTVQSIGEADNADLRDAINRGSIPGPRVITSLGSLNERSAGGSPDSLRAVVRRFKARGADVIKIFASKSIRDGGEATMSPAQLEAACGESKAQGLRSVVHAHSAESVQRAARANCTQVEHGVFADDATRTLLVERGTFFDPQCGLVFHNYLDNKSWFEGIGNYNAEGFASMERALPLAEAGIGSASRTKRLKLVFGTDAVAGAHGRNAEELVCRVRRGGQPAMEALISATSLAAESLGLDKEIGRIAVGFAADMIATDGDPSREIEATERVRFVMRNGIVYRNDPTAVTVGVRSVVLPASRKAP
jgi:imidazolonepropionase-like amidohydrolase